MSTNILTKADVRKFDDKTLITKVSEVREANAEIGQASDGIVWNAALLFGDATRRGIIGKDQHFPTQGDYARAAGYKDTMGTLLKRLSVAQVLGVKRDEKVWTFLTHEGTNGQVGAVFKAEPASKKALMDGLRPLMSEHASTGKIAPAKKAAQATASEKEADTKEATAPVVPTSGDVLAVLAGLRVTVHSLDRDGWSKVEDAMNKFITDENHRRTLLAKDKGAKVTATPATVAKAATKAA